MEEIGLTAEELKALRSEHAPQATDEQFTNWLTDCRLRGLVPGRDVVIQIRPRKEFDPETRTSIYVKRAIYITTIGAFRKIAERSGRYAGQRPSQWVYLDSDRRPLVVSDIPLPNPADLSKPEQPWAVRASVLRTGFREPLTVVARFDAYAQRDRDGKLTSMWVLRGPEQLEKCAEALALRKAFPEALAGLYIAEELEQADNPAPEPAAEQPQTAVPVVETPAVDHTQAEPKERVTEKPAAPVEAAPEPTPKSVEVPATEAERKAFIARAKAHIKALVKSGHPDGQLLVRNFLATHSGVKSDNQRTAPQWESALAALDTAAAQKNLFEIVQGGGA